MKLLTTILISNSIFLLAFASHYKMPVKYLQHFGNQEILITEQLTIAEKLLLPRKNGFIKIYE